MLGKMASLNLLGTDSSGGEIGGGSAWQPAAGAVNSRCAATTHVAAAAANLARHLRASESVLRSPSSETAPSEALSAPVTEAAVRALYTAYVEEVRMLIPALGTDPSVSVRIEVLTLELDEKMSRWVWTSPAGVLQVMGSHITEVIAVDNTLAVRARACVACCHTCMQ